MTEHPGEHIGTMGRPGEGNVGLRLAIGAAVLVVLAQRFGFLTVLVVAGLILAILLHELGHYLTARWSGMKVTEFFLGFGPKLWSFHRDGIEYGVKAIPAGAYVRIVGMNNLEEVEPADEPRTYRQQSYPKRLLVASAGSLMHFLLAFVLLFTMFVGFGVIRDDVWRVGDVQPLGTDEKPIESPAQRAGIGPGDRIVQLDGRPAGDARAVGDYIRARAGKRIELVVADRSGVQRTVTVTPLAVKDDGKTVGRIGIAFDFPLQPMSPLAAVPESASTVVDIGWQSAVALGRFFSPANLADYAGRVLDPPTKEADGSGSGDGTNGDNRLLSPVGFVRVASQAADQGVYAALQLMVLINVFVGIFNLVPLLPFDGGHVAVATYERIRSRRGRPYHADVAKLLPLTVGVVALLAVMGLSALWLDLASPLSNPFNAP